MREFFTWRFWLSIGALLGLTALLVSFTRDDDSLATQAASEVSVPTAVEPRRIDLIALVFQAQADPGFAIVRGRTNGNMQIQIDGTRFMHIGPDTPGENRCGELTELARCMVAADLLGDSVIWFSILPADQRNNQVTLPAISELREGGLAVLANGWIVRRADNVTRECEQDSRSLGDFVSRFGDASSVTFNTDDQQIVKVTCTGDGVEATTSSTDLPVLPVVTSIDPITGEIVTIDPLTGAVITPDPADPTVP